MALLFGCPMRVVPVGPRGSLLSPAFTPPQSSAGSTPLHSPTNAGSTRSRGSGHRSRPWSPPPGTRQTREAGVHRLDHPAQVAGLDLELLLSAGMREARSGGENDLDGDSLGGHSSRPLRWSSASRTFGGDIGSSCIRRPIASATAFAMAAIGGQMLTSPTPFTP